MAEHMGEELAKEASISKGKVKAHQLRLETQKMNNPGGGRKVAIRTTRSSILFLFPF